MADSALITFCTGLAAGLAGFAHCLAMCGGFVLFLSRGGRGRMPRELQWLAGKLVGYLFLGAVAGFAGGRLTGMLGGFAWFQRGMAVAVGGGFVLAALALLGLLPVAGGNGSGGGILTMCLTRVCSAHAPGAPLLAGVASAFLPCPVLLALLAHALQLGSVGRGIVLMGGLGTGTAVPLLVLAAAGRAVLPAPRSRAPRIAGVLLLVLGLATVLRSTIFFHTFLGCPAGDGIHADHATRAGIYATGGRHDGGHGR